jgi:hypothetical protein
MRIEKAAYQHGEQQRAEKITSLGDLGSVSVRRWSLIYFILKYHS